MVVKYFVGATCTCIVVISFNANTAFVSAQWKTAGGYLITCGTNSGFSPCGITS